MEVFYKSEELVEDIAVSHDGRLLALSTETGVIVMDIESKQLILEHTLEEGIMEVETLHFDRMGNLIMDHRSHLAIWNGKDIIEPPFQENCPRGFCYRDSNLKEEYLFYMPQGNIIYWAEPKLQNIKEIMYLSGGMDFHDIHIFFLSNNRIVIGPGGFNGYYIYSLNPDMSPMKLHEIDKWNKGTLYGVADDTIALKDGNRFIIKEVDEEGKISDHPGFKQISIDPSFNIWLRPDLQIIAQYHDQKLTWHNTISGEQINSIPMEYEPKTIEFFKDKSIVPSGFEVIRVG